MVEYERLPGACYKYQIVFRVLSRVQTHSHFVCMCVCVLSGRIHFVLAKNPRGHMFKCVSTSLMGAKVFHLLSLSVDFGTLYQSYNCHSLLLSESALKFVFQFCTTVV